MIDAGAFGLDELDAAGIGNDLLGGIDDLHQRGRARRSREPCERRRISAIGDQKSDSTTISASAEGAKDGGRLGRSASSCSIACAILSMTLRLAVGAHQAGNADALAAGDQQLGEREGDDQRALELGSRAPVVEANAIDGERSGQIQTVCAASHSCSRT